MTLLLLRRLPVMEGDWFVVRNLANGEGGVWTITLLLQ